jgi:hypothetical protein
MQTTREEVENDLITIAEEIEERFFNRDQGIFTTFEYQRFVRQTFIRGEEVEN